MNAWRNLRCFVFAAMLLVPLPSARAAVDLTELFGQIKTLMVDKRYTEAQGILDQSIALYPTNSQLYYARGQVYQASEDHAKAVAAFSQVVKLDPKAMQAYQQLGVEHFRLGQFNESIADFDKVIQIQPVQEPYHWQRGISYYYAGRFKEGRLQFELHQTVNRNDVENAVWHFLCSARESGLARARSTLIPISGDSRIPMMEVHALFAGNLKPEDVLAAVKKGDPKPAELKHRQFYADLYLGLYFDATGDEVNARKYILSAASEAEPGDYMGDVARVHAWVFGKKGKAK